MSELHKPKIAILASGNGSTAEAYARAIHNGIVSAEIGAVISDYSNARVLERAERWNQKYGFETAAMVINGTTHPRGNGEQGQTDEESEAICRVLSDGGFSLVALLGYMRVVRGDLMEQYGYLPNKHTSPYQARMVNSHPGPLPLTAGLHGDGPAEKVLEAYRRGEVKKSHHTVHVVAPSVDEGPVIAAHDVPIVRASALHDTFDTKESLFERTQWIEKATIAYAVDGFLRRQAAYLEESQNG